MSPRLRNELITRTYGDLAEAMADLLGRDNATWVGFGQWASYTIGRYLEFPVPFLGSAIAQAFGDGNRDVFADIGRAHITFLDTVGQAYRDGADVDKAWTVFRRRLNRDLFHPPGGPAGGTEDEFWASIADPRLELGPRKRNQLLLLAFRAYRNALTDDDPERKARSILLGNCFIGLHEQRLLSLAISVGFRSWLRTLTTPWQMFTTNYRWRHRPPGGFRLALENWWIHFATRHVIGVAMPTGTARVGRQLVVGDDPIVVTARKANRRRGRIPVKQLSDDDLLGELFARFEVDGRPASCWNDLLDRMAFIIALFASHQRQAGWFEVDGSTVRPEPWPKLEAELVDHAERIALAASMIEQEAQSPTKPPLTDAQLDFLRSKSPDLSRLADNELDFQSLSRPEGRRALKPIADEFGRCHQRLTKPGGLLDAETCRQARRLFRSSPALWFLGLLMRSLPESYASAIGAHALGHVSDLATNSFRRTGETARFVLDLLVSPKGWDDEGAMACDGPAYMSVRGVRCMHAIAASKLAAGKLPEDGWNSSRYGTPINVEDLLGAALSFCVPPIEMMDDLGFDLKAANRDVYVRFWLGIGVLFGIPEDVVTDDDGRCLTYEQAQALSSAIRRRHHARSFHGVRLTEALLSGTVDGFPRFAGWLVPGLMQVFGRDEVNRQLMVTLGPGRRVAAVVAAVFSRLLMLPGLQRLTRRILMRLAKRWVMPFAQQGRTRPYRRPLQPDDDRRRNAELQAADHWPANCPVDRASSRSEPPPQHGPSSASAPGLDRRSYLAPQALWLIR